MFLLCNLRWAVVIVMVAGVLAPSGDALAGDEYPAESATVAKEEPAGAEKVRERNWRLRFMGAFASEDNGIFATSLSGYSTSVSAAGGVGAGVNFEYRYTPRLGFEMGAMAVSGGVDVGVWRDNRHLEPGVEVGTYIPVTFALNFHALKEGNVFDVYVGPLVATTIISNVAVGRIVEGGSRVDLGLGGNLGFDINLRAGSRWSLNGGLKYITNVADRGDDLQISFDPLIWTFGFGIKL